MGMSLLSNEIDLATLETSVISIRDNFSKFFQYLPTTFINTDMKNSQPILDKHLGELDGMHIMNLGEGKSTNEIFQKEQIKNSNELDLHPDLKIILGNLIWRASKSAEVINTWLSSNDLINLLPIASERLMAFTYTVLPRNNNADYRLLMGLLGIITNVLASPEGRELVIARSECKDFTRNAVRVLPQFPTIRELLPLRRIILKIFYNIAMKKVGSKLLFESQVTSVFAHNLTDDPNIADTELQYLCLCLLHAIMHDLEESAYALDVMKYVPFGKIEHLSTSGPKRLTEKAKKIIQQLCDIQKIIEIDK